MRTVRNIATVHRPSPRTAVRGLPSRSAFTLVEMLVSVSLVLLLMLMLATVFALATETVTEQRGIGQNDQRMRMLTTIIRDDLDNRTFKTVVPFSAGETEPNPLVDPSLAFNLRQGYFYISENEPANDTDDVLRFTAHTTDDPYYGRAMPLGVRSPPPPLTPAEQAYLYDNRKQPDWDDGLALNQTMTSPYAEIVYFLRGGNLYRRTLLIRDDSDPQPKDDSTPSHDYFDPANDGMGGRPPKYPGTFSGPFWNDFDMSAHYGVDRAMVHGVQHLDNKTGAVALGQPYYRFGFDHASGMPREYITGGVFIGAFTQEETSSAAFQYPQSTAGGNPMSASTPLTLSNGVVAPYEGGPRRAEDIVMTHVHAFDVKVWDDLAGAFVDLGSNSTNNPGGTPAVDYATSANPGYGNRIYDTWHPGNATPPANPVSTNMPGNGNPPFRPTDPSGDPKRLKAIQITIRFHDVGSDQTRQMTLVQSLLKE